MPHAQPILPTVPHAFTVLTLYSKAVVMDTLETAQHPTKTVPVQVRVYYARLDFIWRMLNALDVLLPTAGNVILRTPIGAHHVCLGSIYNQTHAIGVPPTVLHAVSTAHVCPASKGTC